MTKDECSLGAMVAWTMRDGNIMAGSVKCVGISKVDVKRVDGGIITADPATLRFATFEDIDKAIMFYQRLGL